MASSKNKKSIKLKIGSIAIIVFTLYVVVSLAFIGNDIVEKNKAIDVVNGNIEDVQILNEEIQKVIDDGVNTDYIIAIAREKLGLVFPNEDVYVDIGSN